MTALRISAAIVLVAVASVSLAQNPGAAGERGSTPPGTSQDGSRPSDGAITGGSIVPGETGGVPNASSNRLSEREAANRCKELGGVLREECMRDLGASTGGTRAPEVTPPGVGRDPVTAPPPQNPR